MKKVDVRHCDSFPGYSADELGNIYSHRRRRSLKGSIGGSVAYIDYSHRKKLSPATTKKGYLQVSIKTPKGKRPIGVHRLVADAFLGPCPDGHHVRHLDDSPQRNVPSNLAYGTATDNASDRKRLGNYTSGGSHHNAKLTNGQAREIREKRRLGVKVKELSQEYGVSISTIESIIYRKSYL